MSRILIGTAGGAPANNFVMSLRAAADGHHLIGTCAVPSDLMLADVEERYVVPYADAPEFFPRLRQIIEKSRPDFIHSQHDFEVRALSRLRDPITKLGVKLFLPDAETV